MSETVGHCQSCDQYCPRSVGNCREQCSLLKIRVYNMFGVFGELTNARLDLIHQIAEPAFEICQHVQRD